MVKKICLPFHVSSLTERRQMIIQRQNMKDKVITARKKIEQQHTGMADWCVLRSPITEAKLDN